MTPRRDRWTDFSRPYAPRLDVEGGVAVPRTWKPSTPEAVRLVVTAEGRTTSGIASRGRTYARLGQVVEVRVDDHAEGGAGDGTGDGTVTASAAVQGSDAAPYAVSLSRLPDGAAEATCTCPYGCDDVEWCKHAAALAFVVAHLLETSPDVAAVWLGQEDDGPDAGSTAGTEAGPAGTAAGTAAVTAAEAADLVAALRRRPPVVDAAAAWRAALDVLPLA